MSDMTSKAEQERQGESRLRLYGFSLAPPEVRAARATIEKLAYDPQTRLFGVSLSLLK
jgi:hypothetical protein